MSSIPVIGTRDVPLKLAKKVTELAEKEWNEGSFLEKVTPVTADLLRYWFEDAFCNEREFNFHQGQKQAILNTIYLHEILGVKGAYDTYMKVEPGLLAEMDLTELKQDKY